MGAGASVAQELLASSPPASRRRGRRISVTASPIGPQYREMLDHLRHRFEEELVVLREKYGEVDRDSLVAKLLIGEICFTTIEVEDLDYLKTQQRDKTKVYLLGDSHFGQSSNVNVDMTALRPKALEIAGDDQLSAVAREALPANAKTNKKVVELMGSTKVVTEKKALKRLGSEMTEDMRMLQMKTERKEQKEQKEKEGETNRLSSRTGSMADLSSAAVAGKGRGAGGGRGGAGGEEGRDGIKGDDAARRSRP